jgi:hypothetical protein
VDIHLTLANGTAEWDAALELASLPFQIYISSIESVLESDYERPIGVSRSSSRVGYDPIMTWLNYDNVEVFLFQDH